MKKKFNFYALKLCLILSLVFILQKIIPGFTQAFVLNKKVFTGEIWRIVSAIFLHANLLHLLYNCFALGLFGSIVEGKRGGKTFLSIFFTSGIIANIVAVWFYNSSLGASGAIFGVIGFLMIIEPMLWIWAFGFPLPLILAGALWIIGDLIGAWGFLNGNPLNNNGNIAHLIGTFIGIIFGFFKKVKKVKKKIKITEKDIQKFNEVISNSHQFEEM